MDIDLSHLGIKVEGHEHERDEEEYDPVDSSDIDIDIDEEFLDIADLFGSHSSENESAAVTAITTTFKKLLRKVQVLESQVASCLKTQSLAYQAIGKCTVLEEHVNAIKEDVDRRLSNVLGTGGQHQNTQPQDRWKIPLSRHPTRRHELRTSSPLQKSRTQPKAKPKREIVVVQLAIPEQNQSSNQNAVPLPHHSSQESQRCESDSDFDWNTDATDREDEEYRMESGPGDLDKNPNQFKYQCKVCPLSSNSTKSKGTAFKSAEGLARHYTSRHSAGISDEVVQVQIREAETGDKPHECIFCRLKFASKKDMRDHKRSVHRLEGLRVQCTLCGRSLHERSLKAHMEVHGGDKRQRVHCETCGAGFLHRKDLRMHTRIHTGDKMFPCTHPQCGKQFNRRSVLATHLLTHVPDKDRRPFTCAHCGRGFTKKHTLEEHELIHTGKPFVCDECGWAFARSSKLRDHKRCHAEGKTRKPAGANPDAIRRRRIRTAQAQALASGLAPAGRPSSSGVQ